MECSPSSLPCSFPFVAACKLGPALHADNLALRHQLLLLQRLSQDRRLRLQSCDRLLWVWLSIVWSNWRCALRIVEPETVIAWHRQGFRLYWKWKSRVRHGRPSMPGEIQNLIRNMSSANPCWGAPCIHGELQKLGINLAQATVAKYMVPHRKPPSQTWRTFLDNHRKELVSTDFFVVPTATFRLLFVFLVLSHDRRRLLHFGVTSHPTAEWTARQLHFIVLHERGLHRTLKSYFEYYEQSRTHLSLDKDAPLTRAIQRPAMGRVIELPQVGGLHHRYERRAA